MTVNRSVDSQGRMQPQGSIDLPSMDEAILDVLTAHLPHAEDGEARLGLSFEDWEATFDEEDCSLPGAADAAMAILEIANAYPKSAETWRSYAVDLASPSATGRAAALRNIPAEAAAARARVEALLRRNRKRKALRAFTQGLEQAATQARDEGR